MTQVNFAIKPLEVSQNFYGFELNNNPYHISPNGLVLHNSGKSVLEQSM